MKYLKVYYEPEVLNYELGKKVYEKYHNIPWMPIHSHNNIEELRSRGNEDFVEMKKYLIIGIRKTHKYTENHKLSQYLVPFTSSGCSAMCLYCYLVCNYNKCSYLRIYANVDEILDKLVNFSKKKNDSLIYEIGSNSDLILENMVTNNLGNVIEKFGEEGNGYITFPTKFHMVDDLLNLKHNNKTIIRMSLNPEYIISKVEIGTSPLKKRIEAINKLCEHGYRVGILIAPVIFVENWKQLYTKLIENLKDGLSDKVKDQIFIEIIFMTYSYIHKAINDQAFPRAIKLYNKDLMSARGIGKYHYKKEYRDAAEIFLRDLINNKLNCPNILYVV